MQAAIISIYFDYDDYDNPVKTHLGATGAISLILGFTQSLEVRVQKNEGSTTDNIFYNINFKNIKYYNANTKIFVIEDINVNNNNILSIYFNLDATSNIYERAVFTYIDMFGFLGGLFDFVLFIGLIFVNYFTDKMYHNSVFANLYQGKSQDVNKNGSNEHSTSKHDFL